MILPPAGTTVKARGAPPARVTRVRAREERSTRRTAPSGLRKARRPSGPIWRLRPQKGSEPTGSTAPLEGVTRQSRVAPRCTDQQSTAAWFIGVVTQERGPREAASRRGPSGASRQSSHWVGDTGRKASQGPVRPAMPRVDAPGTLIVDTTAASLPGAWATLPGGCTAPRVRGSGHRRVTKVSSPTRPESPIAWLHCLSTPATVHVPVEASTDRRGLATGGRTTRQGELEGSGSVTSRILSSAVFE